MDDASKHFRWQLVKDALAFIENIESVVTRPDLRKRLFAMQLDLGHVDSSNPEADNLLNTFFAFIRELEGTLNLASQPV